MQQFAVIAAFAATASAYSVSVYNNCDKPAYIWSCGSEVGEMQTLHPGSAPWSEEMYTKNDNGVPSGPSIYISDTTSHTDGNIAQLEYYFEEPVSTVWWDISLINGEPFPEIALGSDLKSMPYDACKPVKCSGVGKCNGAYLTHEQLPGTHDCPPSNLVMKLCDSEGNWSAGPGSGGAVSSAPKATSTPAATPVPSVKASSADKVPTYTVAPAPKPTTTAAPKPVTTAIANKPIEIVQEDGEGKAVVHTAYATTIVTKVVSVHAPKPSNGYITAGDDGEVHAKRDSHQHQHVHQARAHGRNLRRHNHQA